METRIERDSMGEVRVEGDKLWGAQTQRSLDNFRIGKERMPIEVILALASIKKASARANGSLGVLAPEKVAAISEASDAILRRELDEQFPLSVWQTGSGTQSNMNVNEVIANYASAKAGRPLGSKEPLHPNDDVNRSQSSNDVFPAAMQLSAGLKIKGELLPAAAALQATLASKAREFGTIVKTGRTHMQDAVPITLGQEFSGYAEQLRLGMGRVQTALDGILNLPLGGTAVGTGLNSPHGFASLVCGELSSICGLDIVPAANKFAYMAAHDDLVQLSGTLNSLATALMKIGNDIRLMGSGPRCGLGELILPENEPGSSIMPGKVNPTQVEALTMVCAQVFGNHATISFAGASGQLELNAFKPVIIFDLLQSIDLLTGAMRSFEERCVRGIVADEKRIGTALGGSLMVATVLVPSLGYDTVARVARYAHENNLSLKEALVNLELMTAGRFDELVRPGEMVKEP
ncbi:MAG TPA: class II fumarate hydratase [Rectinemataceae bacterium]|nr:class II fumarate hydratase [Rectinemataceae bacterium]